MDVKNKSKGKRILLTIILVSIFLLGIFTSVLFDTDFGRLEVKTVLMTSGNIELVGLLYKPIYVSNANPSPAIVLAHGIGGSKEMMSSIGLELARHGFVTLCLDLLGHGSSGGTVADGLNNPSFGVLSAVEYLKSQSFINSSSIGLVGHSLGAGAVRATFVKDDGISASVLIAGGLGDVSEGPSYGILNSTFPKNLLVIIGKYDVLFNLTQITAKTLLQAFNTQQEVVLGKIYGSFSSQTARKLVIPETTHLFEPVDSLVISETVAWMSKALKFANISVAEISTNQIYIQRELAIFISLVVFLGIVFEMFLLLTNIFGLRLMNGIAKKHFVLKHYKTFMIWGFLGIVLFLPTFFIGYVVSFPTLIFGSSIAWWMLSTGLMGLLVLVAFLPRVLKEKNRLNVTLKKSFNKYNLVIALILFIFMYTVISLVQSVSNINLRIISPIFQSLNPARRLIAFFEFFPFFLVYFLIEGLFLYELHSWSEQKQTTISDLLNCSKVVFSKIAPFIAVICLQYGPISLFGLWILPSYVGFLVEFLWLIIPIFIITTTTAWFIYRKTKNIWTGAVLNTLMMAWVASTVFPF